MKRRFNSFNTENLKVLKSRDKKLPLVIYANHSSWWDGLILYEICRIAEIDFFVMMEEKQLKELPLFRRLGAFSVVRENARKSLESLNYAVEILHEKPNRGVLIFPQGEIHPNLIRPLKYYGGIGKLIEKTGKCNAVPIALKLEFLGNFKPEVFVKIGQIEKFEIAEKQKVSVENLQKNLTGNLDSLQSEITFGKTENYRNLF